MQAAPSPQVIRFGGFEMNPKRFLGTPGKDKRHVVLEPGHVPPHNEMVKETLDWLDRYLGPVGSTPKN
jgi:hypothetical protein